MADEVQTPLNDGELGIMQPIYTPELAFVPDVGDGGEFQVFKKPSVYVPYVQYDSIESLAVYGSVEGVSSIYVNSHQYVLPIPKPLTAGDVWQSKVKSSYDERIVLDGTEDWRAGKPTEGGEAYFTLNSLQNNSGKLIGSSSHFPVNSILANNTNQGVGAWNTSLYLRWKALFTDVDSLKAYLAAQKAAGTPVVVYYQSTAYDGTNGLTVSIADYQDEIYANNFVDIFTDDGELWADGGDFVEVAVNNIVLNGKTNDERAGEYGTPQVHTFP